MKPSLAASIDGARRIARRLNDSLGELAAFGTIDATAVEAFDKERQKSCDALFKRVESLISQLQDQVWRQVATSEQARLRLGTRRELAELMQRVGLLMPGESFAVAAELRNRLTHEYPTEAAKQAALIRDALAIAPLLLDCVARAEAYFAMRSPDGAVDAG